MDEKAKRRDSYLRTTWGVTLEEYDKVLQAQGGGCVGCGRPGVTRSLHVEHDHRTMLLRAIACASCNSALQKVRDRPEVLRNLADMLEDPPFTRVLGREQKALRPPKKRRRKRRVVKR